MPAVKISAWTASPKAGKHWCSFLTPDLPSPMSTPTAIIAVKIIDYMVEEHEWKSFNRLIVEAIAI
jgi:hypothetical protein